MSISAVPSALAASAVAKAGRRLVWLLVLLYVINYLDRVNVGFAALRMNADIGLSAAAYGLGAGLFFIGYFLFEVPSNLIMHKFGAKVWMARIMVSWGVLAC
ncbi:MAG: transporter, family, tartrate transporter, partial [Pseudonocardiales bacterium]|nr:transporter, family, tartrate transporter [Pseudonocardiales bacterium]